jgi:DNA adenine methylase
MIGPLLKYPGAKWRLASWLQRFTPRSMRVLDAYCGSGAFALTLEYRPDHLILNDRDRYLNLLFRCLRERRDDLITAITFTPWSRAEYLDVTGPAGSIVETGDLVEDARRILIATWQAHGTTICTRNGWRHKGHKRIGRQLSDTYEQWQQLPARLGIAAALLSDAEIECLPALSGYHNAIYDARLTRWHRVETKTQAEKGNTRIECLWLNAVCVERLGNRPTHEQEAMQL